MGLCFHSVDSIHDAVPYAHCTPLQQVWHPARRAFKVNSWTCLLQKSLEKGHMKHCYHWRASLNLSAAKLQEFNYYRRRCTSDNGIRLMHEPHQEVACSDKSFCSKASFLSIDASTMQDQCLLLVRQVLPYKKSGLFAGRRLRHWQARWSSLWRSSLSLMGPNEVPIAMHTCRLFSKCRQVLECSPLNQIQIISKGLLDGKSQLTPQQ